MEATTHSKITAQFARGFSTEEAKLMRSAARRVFCATDNDRYYMRRSETEERATWTFTCHTVYDGPVLHTISVSEKYNRPLSYNVARGLAKVEAAVHNFPVINEMVARNLRG